MTVQEQVTPSDSESDNETVNSNENASSETGLIYQDVAKEDTCSNKALIQGSETHHVIKCLDEEKSCGKQVPFYESD